jgi:multisubunit Na+/H+ antiporter MnhB subunit
MRTGLPGAWSRYLDRVGGSWPKRAAVRLSTFLVERPLASFIITAVVLFLQANAIRRVLNAGGGLNGFTWVALGFALYATIAVAALLRSDPARFPPGFRLLFAWAVGLTPAESGFGAALAGSPVLVMWFGVGLSLCLIAWAGISTRRTQR